jgi:alkylated DNA repair dioxygenase AlkB
MTSQLAFFDAEPALPAGFRYASALLTADEESDLVAGLRDLPLEEFEFHGYRGKRRVASFGWRYDFGREALDQVDDIPPFLRALRERAAGFAAMDAERLQQVLVTEYDAGAGIGWHRDKAVFGEIVGISLLAPCVFRLRRKTGAAWQRVSITAEPRSAYLLSGPSRSEWEHSIPPVESLRYSVTFRNLRDDAGASPSARRTTPK